MTTPKPERKLPPSFDIDADYFAKDPPLDLKGLEEANREGHPRVVIRDGEPLPRPKRGRRDAPRP